jgi:hypothetical protein
MQATHSSINWRQTCNKPGSAVWRTIGKAPSKSSRVVVGKNLKYVIETLRAEGSSPWFAASHDEFAVVLDGEIDVHFIKPSDGPLVDAQTEGSVRLDGQPSGQSMGFVRLRRGHQALLPAGAAYRFEAVQKGVLLVQTILGRDSVQKWADICIQ